MNSGFVLDEQRSFYLIYTEGITMMVPVVSADAGTKAGKVLKQIAKLALEQSLPIVTAKDCFAGLNLREVPGKSFSLKYKKEGDVLVLPIGRDLPESRALHVAQSIIAMIRRGENWQDKGKNPDFKHIHTCAYGADRGPKAKKPRKRGCSRYRTHSGCI